MIDGLRSSTFTLGHLESSTDYTFRVRARLGIRRGAFSAELVARTEPPDRLLPAPDPPARHVTEQSRLEGQPSDGDQKVASEAGLRADCAIVPLHLPRLRRGCIRDTALSLEYRNREAGAGEWRKYGAGGDGDEPSLLTSDEVVLMANLPREHSRGSVDFRLRAHRGPLASEPSAVLGPIDVCARSGPARSLKDVEIALGVAGVLLVLCVAGICRTMRAQDGAYSKEKPPKREPGMQRLKTTDDDEQALGPDDDELSVRYELGDESKVIEGMLPLTGIATSAELLDEIAEFGCELQDDIILNVSMFEATYQDRGKTKVIGPRTSLDAIIEAGSVTVTSKATVSKDRMTPVDDPADESAIQIKVAPRDKARGGTRAYR